MPALGGIGILLKQMGLDPQALIDDFDKLKKTIVSHLEQQTEALKEIKASQLRMEGKINAMNNAPPDNSKLYDAVDVAALEREHGRILNPKPEGGQNGG